MRLNGIKKTLRQNKDFVSGELKRLAWAGAGVAAAAVNGLLKDNAVATEQYYSRGMFAWTGWALNNFFGLIPLSIAELLLYALAILVPTCITVCIVKVVKGRAAKTELVRLTVTLVMAAGLAFAAFYLLWGFNYNRLPLSHSMSLNVMERPTQELESLCYDLLDTAKELRQSVNEDENGVFRIDEGIIAMRKIPPAYDKLALSLDLIDRTPAPPKPVLFSEGLSRLGIAGIYFPFTAEANVNCHQPDLLLLSSAAHEAAHALGFARENEANFLAYLACDSSDDAQVRYSGVMLALIHAGNALHDADNEAYAKLRSEYPDSINNDLDDNNAYWKQYESETSDNMEKLNDSYLKFNSQQSGVRSYGEMVDLLLAYRAG